MSIGIWEPYWLGDRDRQLYAALHRPASMRGSTAVLFAPPLLHEQPRSRRFVTEVASGLAALGLPCLRFDFFGTGDSAGASEQLDFDSMSADLSLATRALRQRTGAERIAVLAWRASSLALWHWALGGGVASRLIFWEPLSDGAQWLAKLEHDDAGERCSPDRYPLMHGQGAVAGDRQLMGFTVSQQLRGDLSSARLAGNGRLGDVPLWAVLRPGEPEPPLPISRSFALPASAPEFGSSTRMDATMFVTPRLQQVVDELGRALVAEA